MHRKPHQAAPRAPQYLESTSVQPSAAHPLVNAPAGVQRLSPVVTPVAPSAAPNASAATTTPVRADSDKTEALERAIKQQYVWSGGESMPKPTQ